jgi:hypothetical protein
LQVFKTDICSALLDYQIHSDEALRQSFQAGQERRAVKGYAIGKLEQKEKRLIRMCGAEAISISELKRDCMIVKALCRFDQFVKRDQKVILEQVHAEIFFRGESVTASSFRSITLTETSSWMPPSRQGRSAKRYLR